MAKLTFLGTGLMGGALAEAATKRGDSVVAYNRTLEKARALESLGVRVAATPRDAVAGAERVHIVVKDDAAVDALLDASVESIGSAIVIDHTTTSPAGTVARAARLEREGVAFLHAPVFMSPQACREAAGVMLVAGPRKTFERVQDGLRAMTGKLEYLGERPDLAAVNKLFGNAMILAITAGLADVFAMARALGIEASEAHELFSKFNPVGTLAYRGRAMANGDYRASFELSMASKDVRLMLETVEGTGSSLRMLPTISDWIDSLIERGHGKDDLGALAIDAVPRRQ